MSMYKDTALVTGDLGPRLSATRPPLVGEFLFTGAGGQPNTIEEQPDGYPKLHEYGRWWVIRHDAFYIGVQWLPMAHVPAWMEAPECPRKEAS